MGHVSRYDVSGRTAIWRSVARSNTKRYIKGYVHFMKLARDTGSMFWATKQLGDGEGSLLEVQESY
jgi:hypothetical protein